MAIDLNKLEERFKNIVKHTSQEEFERWLDTKEPLDENGYPIYGTFRKQQTAVEWFFKWFNDNPEATHKDYLQAFEQAKQMEKEQIIDACFEGMNTFPFDANKGRAEQYYNQTYGAK